MKKELKDYFHLYIGAKFKDVWNEDEVRVLTPEQYGLYTIALDQVKLVLRRIEDITNTENLRLQEIVGAYNHDNFNEAIQWVGHQSQYLRSIGIDIDGLIDAGLALDANKMSHLKKV